MVADTYRYKLVKVQVEVYFIFLVCSKIHLLGLKLGSEVQLPTFNNTLFSDFPGGSDSKASAYNRRPGFNP